MQRSCFDISCWNKDNYNYSIISTLSRFFTSCNKIQQNQIYEQPYCKILFQPMLQTLNRFFLGSRKEISTNKEQKMGKFELQLFKKPEGSKIIKWQDGTVYIGQCKELIMEGVGKLFYPNGEHYEGQFKNNNFHGKGKYYAQDAFYDGEWQNGVKNGFAKQINSDKSTYIGKYKNGFKQGLGFFQWPDGSFYQGMFRGDLMEGPGKMAYSDGSQIEGQWKQNFFQGMGRHIDRQGNVFIGFFQNGIKHGRGLQIKMQCKIQGFWKNGSLTGLATLERNNGQCVFMSYLNDSQIQINDQQYNKLRDQNRLQTIQ